MMLLEHDAKDLLARCGLAAPEGVWVEDAADLEHLALPPAPWMVKAQVPVGGRGKAGAIRPAATVAEAKAEIERLLGSRVLGHPVRACRLETRTAFVHEAYLSLIIDPLAADVRVVVSAAGGIDVEQSVGAVRSALAQPDEASVREAAQSLARELPESHRGAVAAALAAAAAAFFRYEALLVEINPLFIRADGSWLIGDAKLAVDVNALARQPEIRSLIEAKTRAYPEAALKLRDGFDYVELDPEGAIGLLTTGAGLSMKLIDELIGKGERPINFVDIRTGELRGDPARVVRILDTLSRAPRLRVLLINVFAGITDLGEFAALLVRALEAVPAFDVPIVARLIGRGASEVQAQLRGARLPIVLEPDLDRAVAKTAELATGRGAPA